MKFEQRLGLGSKDTEAPRGSLIDYGRQPSHLRIHTPSDMQVPAFVYGTSIDRHQPRRFGEESAEMGEDEALKAFHRVERNPNQISRP